MRNGSANQYENACSSPVTGSILGCAVRPLGSGPPKSVRRSVSSSPRQLVGHRAFCQRQDAARVTEHVGVARVVHRRRGALDRLFADRARDLVGAHPAVAVPARGARVELHAVHHAVTDEPVVRAFRHAIRVRSGAQVATSELGRDGPFDDEVGRGDLLVDGSVVAGQERVLGHRHGCSSGRAPCHVDATPARVRRARVTCS